ncbi:MAG: nucleotidyltransferase family protein [Anaerolineales bacterium]|nr:nucleotidyltransferase family protein [Anaerolineales bacterium]
MTTLPLELPGDIWPNATQQRLLQAALLPGEAGRAAWQAWRAAADPQRLDAGSHRLLPLLYHNLRALGVADPALPYYKAIYRQTWYKNNTLFHQMAGVLTALRAAGLDTLVLKGAPLALQYYLDLGLRPMGDFDLLVRTAEMPRVVAALAEQGWRPFDQPTIPPGYLEIQQAGTFTHADGRHFDLHWHALWDCTTPDADFAFWEQAEPLEIHHAPTLALGPTDQLLHVCVHGARYDAIPPLRWLADAMQIFHRAAARLDWARLLQHAEQRRLVLPLRDTLGLLHTLLDAPVPPDVLAALAALPVTAQERRYYRARLRRPGTFGYFPLEWERYQALAHMAGRRISLPGFGRYLRLIWRLSHPAELPGRALRKAWLRLTARNA